MALRKIVYFIIPSFGTIGGVEDLVSRFSQILAARYEMKVITFDKYEPNSLFKIKCEIIPVGNRYWNPIKYLIIFFKLLVIKKKSQTQTDIFISILPAADIVNGATKFFSGASSWSLWVINVKGNLDNGFVFQFRKIFGIFYRRLDKIFCIDEFLENEPNGIFKCDPKKVRLFYNFISLDHFKVQLRQRGLVSLPFTILFCARLEPIKNPLSVIHVAKSLKNMNVSVRFIIVGAGSLEDQMINCASNIGLTVSFGQLKTPTDVVFIPPQRDLSGVLDCSDLFILPSLSEGFPTVIGTGLARGTPIIVSNVFGGLNRVRGSVIHEEFGFTFFSIGAFGPVPRDQSDFDAWASSIRFIMENQELFPAIDCRKCIMEWSAANAERFWHQQLSGETSNL